MMVRFIYILLLVPRFAFGECTPERKADLKSDWKFLQEEAEKYDRRSLIEAFREGLIACEIATAEEIQTLKDRSVRSEYLRLTNLLIENSQAGRVDKIAKAYNAYLPNVPPGVLAVIPPLDTRTFVKQGWTAAAKAKKDCTPIDLRSKFPQRKTRDQDSLGWCFAFAAADLLSAKTGKVYSAAYMSLLYQKETNDIPCQVQRAKPDGTWETKSGFDEGGWSSATINLAVQKGVCLEKDMPSQTNKDPDLGAYLEEVCKKYLNADIVHYSARLCTKLGAASGFGDSSAAVEQILDQAGYRSFLDEQLKSCKPQKPKGINTVQIRSEGNPMTLQDQQKMVAKFDRQLEKGNPIEFDYDADILYDAYRPLPKIEDGHASILVGRRFNEYIGECEYLIRNSWGTDCGSYDKNLRCENGNVWVPKSAVTRGVYGGVYLD